MIKIIKQIEECFNALSESNNNSETITELSVVLRGNTLSIPKEDCFNFINERDSYSITVYDEDGECLNTYVSNACSIALDQFIKETPIEPNYKLKFEIHKANINNEISIYSLTLIENTLLKYELITLLNFFKKSHRCKDCSVIFRCLNDDINICSRTFYFTNLSTPITTTPILQREREDRINKLKSVAHNNTNFTFIPEDFHLIDSDEIHHNLISIFNRLELLISMTFIFDLIELNKPIGYKLNGYKSLSGTFEFNNLNHTNGSSYYNIYAWIYNEGNLVDKIGLARNIISLNINKCDLQIAERTFESIKSSYRIYQKQNIKQYIEIRNKISDQLFDIYNKADKITDNFIDSFKKSIFTAVSFFISVVAIRVISKGDFIGGFSFEVTIISIALLIISLFVLIYNKWEITEQIERYKQFYNNLKERYTDLLDSSDIDRILNKDKDFLDSISFIERKKKFYTIIWISSISILLIIILLLYSLNNWCFICHNFVNLIRNVIECCTKNILK